MSVRDGESAPARTTGGSGVRGVGPRPLPRPAVSHRPRRARGLGLCLGVVSHVEMLAGQLPAAGLGGGDTAVTMPQSGADAAGFALFDRVCVAFAGGGDRESRWCARIVGLWRPLDAQDPFWAGRATGLE